MHYAPGAVDGFAGGSACFSTPARPLALMRMVQSVSDETPASADADADAGLPTTQDVEEFLRWLEDADSPRRHELVGRASPRQPSRRRHSASC